VDGFRLSGSLRRRVPDGSVLTGAALLIVAAIAAFLRLEGLGEPSYWLDEILGQDLTSAAASQPWWRWLTGFEREHGPLYYLSQLATRPFGSDETLGRLPAAAAGIFAVTAAPFILLARDRSIRAAGLVAAALLALSPMHVYYSREARPYALLMLLAVLLLLVLLHARSIAATAAILIAILYTSAVGLPLVAATAVAAFVAERLSTHQDARRYFRFTAVFAAATVGLFLLLYRGAPQTGGAAPFPALDAELASAVLRQLTVSVLDPLSGGRTAAAILVLAIAGGAYLWRRDRPAAAIVIAMALVPVVLSLLALWVFDHWYSARYLSPALPAFLLLAAAGTVAAARLVTAPLRSRWPRPGDVSAVVLTVAIVTAIAAQTWPATRSEAYQKLDWRSVARTIWNYSRAGDAVVTAEPWSEVSLGHYLRQLPPKVRFARADAVPIAAGLITGSEATWLVTAGFSGDSSVRNWICRYPLLLSSEHEDLRIHYAPSAQHFLDHRGGTAEHRALAAALGTSGFTLDMDSGDDLLLRDGWAGPESVGDNAFRWAASTAATVSLPRPRPRDRLIRMRVLPLMHWTLSEQTVTLSLNGVIIADWTLASGWAEYTVPASAALWLEGRNELTFAFGRATRPTAFDRESKDERPLAAAFDWISVYDRDPDAAPAFRVPPLVRIASDVPIRPCDGAGSDLRLSSDRLQREPAAALLGRLGFDPEQAWERLQRGDATLECYAQTVAHGSSCLDDRAFVRDAYAAILGRTLTAGEERSVLTTLRSGVTRSTLVRRMLTSDEFQARMLRAGRQ
jgi:mannosyltransferase